MIPADSYYLLGCYGRQRVPKMITAWSPNAFDRKVAHFRAEGARLWWLVAAPNSLEAIRIARGLPATSGRLIETNSLVGLIAGSK